MNEDMIEKGEEEMNDLEVKVSHASTSLTDVVNIAGRGDGSVLLQLLSIIPGGVAIENHRTVMNNPETKSLIDNLCDLLDYYPEKTEGDVQEED